MAFPNRTFVTHLALEAGDILLKYFRRRFKVERKRAEGIVTEADKSAESYLIKKIFRKYPQSSIITEESGVYEGSRALRWIIDPLDGTSNFAHGFPWYAVSIGLYEGDRPKIGVVYNPSMNELFVAQAGKGSQLNGKGIAVSQVTQLEDALLGTGFYYSKGRALKHQVEVFRKFNQHALGVRRPGAAALDLAYVACGRYDGFWEKGLQSWDVAAGMLLVKEAGGRVSNYRGKTSGLFDREIVASNRKLHRKMLPLLK